MRKIIVGLFCLLLNIAAYSSVDSDGLSVGNSINYKNDKMHELEIYSFNNPPYFAQTLPNQGFVSCIVKDAFSASGYQLNIKFAPIIRSRQVVKASFADGLFAVPRKDIDAESFLFSDQLFNIELIFVGLKDNPKITELNNPEDLNKFIIVAGANVAIPSEINVAHLNMITSVDNQSAIRQLFSGKVDIALIDKNLFAYYKKNIFAEYNDHLIEVDYKIPMQEEYYFVIAKSNPKAQETMLAFNNGLKKLHDSGRLSEIINSYDQ